MSSDPTIPSAPECSCLSRRQSFRAAGAVGASVVGVGGLAACGSGDDVQNAASSVAGAASSAASAASDAIKAADIPVGGGKVFEALSTVVTQPTAGEYKAFSSVCTHQGCQVSGVANGVISCACHGSQFDAATGAVKQGPATKPLPEKSVTVSGDGLTVS